MYNKKLASEVRSKFWTTFGKYMDPVPSISETKVNWINYKTEVKHIYFRMDAENKTARIGIEITHRDKGLRNLFYEQFEEFKFLLHTTLNEEWCWDNSYTSESGNEIATIYTQLHSKSIFNENDWGEIFTFFKSRIIALDEFWSDAKDIFKDLES